MNLAIIPARGGSKRIPRKNIKPFCGKPMIAWSIEAATASGCFDRIIVSTDDPEIADTARQWGAEVPFVRPAELADDHTATRPVVNHAIMETSQRDGMPSWVCCLYPTAPFVTATDLREALRQLKESQADFVFSAATFAYPIQRAFTIRTDGGLERCYPQYRNTRSQDLEEAYHDAGQFYWGRCQAFLEGKDSVSQNSRAFILPRYRVQDIDTEEDWSRAELMFSALFSADVTESQ
ncbi:pseudaminic acid cytidylyltransferase [Ectothiorhodospira variabilis]|uniref:pseudaminic acid cytidylyltransferase n=1 Tax=Ectothiorhodospira variabilis TaxID=505694 RepID=UPI001EFAC225|nr:pseudaminic acid cytidylyltransferase [Ectothiorhodospira variabilis]MCG5495988.1 pseudaminic acid cytidylyltransferase [Ectothiorhodospira variabilis]MCG5505343.1 pseudaminic acid cytidylyltransferase [Ectothiorhodospira variabilis]MCG5508529.1 pseudaminic acid cytidylyltransferase [Ectothiorhodospira variabilis]